MANPDGLWSTGNTPPCIADGTAPCNVGDFGSLELGVKFQTSKPIYVVGVRFYRADTWTWSGSLWGSDNSWIDERRRLYGWRRMADGDVQLSRRDGDR